MPTPTPGAGRSTPVAALIPTGADLLAYMGRSDIPVASADQVMSAVHEWMSAHLTVDPYTDTHALAALAAGATAVVSRASMGGVTATDIGPIFINDRDVNIRRAHQLFGLGGFA